MKEFKGTKGEWLIDDEWIAHETKQYAICKVYGNHPAVNITKEEYESNIKAISSVPEMIEALKGVVNSKVLFKEETSEEFNIELQAVHEMIRKAESALNKALGE